MNSCVHTLMYTYYAASVYKEGSALTAGLYKAVLPLKPYLTRMQITQVNFHVDSVGLFEHSEDVFDAVEKELRESDIRWGLTRMVLAVGSFSLGCLG